MKPTLKLAEAAAPDGVELALFEHDGTYFLQSGGGSSLSSDASAAEEALGRLACAPFRRVRQPRLLLGGVGLGFAVAAAREALPQKRATFVVAEPESALLAWHRAFLGHLHPGQLGDPRLDWRREALPEALRNARDAYHAILIDARMDAGLAKVVDARDLPRPSFLDRAREGLKNGGLLAVCSRVSGTAFERRLLQAGFDVSRESVPPSRKGKRRRLHTIWLACKAGG